jgi:Caspase domain/Domain of unknown function (DUF4384)
MGLNRRIFLQRAAIALASFGISEILSLMGGQSLAVPMLDRYFQALAQPGGRKLALLVGINQYPRSTALSGCVTDVELQRELLIHRFGFNASDVLTLTDSQATRENIETAFIEHLSNQVKAGDVVVFHFSGYGGQVIKGSELGEAISLSNSLVPVDRLLPTQGAEVANDLLEETLVLLLRSLPTDQVTTILDTSYTPVENVLQGNLRVRSSPHPPAASPNPAELAFQEQLLLRLKASSQPLKKTTAQLPGIVLTAASPTQPATEALWNGFSAGLFTYALTQYLWQASTPTVQISVSRATSTVKQLARKQQPQLLGQKSLEQPLLAYYLPPDPMLGADGVITAVEDGGKTVQIWLAGLPAMVLEYYGSNSLLSISASKTTTAETDHAAVSGQSTQLQLRSKEGLKGLAKIVSKDNVVDDYPLQAGQLVREAVRILPHNLGLTVALDVRLERIERVDATSAFASIPAVSSVVVAGEQAADYLFGKVSLSQTSESVHADGGGNGGYGLFYLASEPIRQSTGVAGEAVKSAVNRLTPKLKTLLAAKLLRLTANEGSSRLGIRATLERVSPKVTVVMQRETLRASWATPALIEQKKQPMIVGRDADVPCLPIGSRVQYRLENYGDAPIYFMLLGFDTSGNAIAFYQMRSLSNQDPKSGLIEAVIAPGTSLKLPQAEVSANWVISGSSGFAEMQLICSRSPFTKAIAVLESSPNLKEGEEISGILNPLEVAQAILQDLHASSAMIKNTTEAVADATNPVSDTYALDVKAWATLSFIYQVV